MFSDVLRMLSDVHRCSQMFPDVHLMFFRCHLDVLKMLSGNSQDIFLMFSGCSHDVGRILWWILWV